MQAVRAKNITECCSQSKYQRLVGWMQVHIMMDSSNPEIFEQNYHSAIFVVVARFSLIKNSTLIYLSY